MDRRSFLKYAGFGTLTLMFGGVAFRIGGVWWDQTAGKGFKILSQQESVIIIALADTLFPGDAQGLPNGVNVGLPEFFDQYLESIPEITSKLLRVLLHLNR